MLVELGEGSLLGGIWKGTGSAVAIGNTAVVPVSGSYCGEGGRTAVVPVAGSYYGEGGRGTRQTAFACSGVALAGDAS